MAAAAVAFMFLYLDCFTLGILPVSWSYSAEIQPLRVRNKSTAVGVFSHWASNFVVVMVTPIGLNNIGGNYFWIWAIVCASFIPLTYFFGVETSGRTLEQIDTLVSFVQVIQWQCAHMYTVRTASSSPDGPYSRGHQGHPPEQG